MNILITGVGGPTPRSFAIALKKYGTYKGYTLIATDINPLSVGLYQNGLFDKSYVIPKATDANYWQVIDGIIDENQIEYAVILPEQEVLEWSRRQKEGILPCKSLIPSYSVSTLLIDKARMLEILTPGRLAP